MWTLLKSSVTANCAEVCWKSRNAPREVGKALEDAAHVAGSDVLLGYLSFYNNVQQAAKRGVA